MNARPILFVTALAAAWLLGASPVQAQDAPNAEELWKKNCASCHGQDLKGATKAGKMKGVKDLTADDVRSGFDRDRMIKSVSEGIKDEAGKERMKGYAGKLSDQEIAALVDFIIAAGK